RAAAGGRGGRRGGRNAWVSPIFAGLFRARLFFPVHQLEELGGGILIAKLVELLQRERERRIDLLGRLIFFLPADFLRAAVLRRGRGRRLILLVHVAERGFARLLLVVGLLVLLILFLLLLIFFVR